MDRLIAMEVFVRVVESGSFSAPRDSSASDSPLSPRASFSLKSASASACCSGRHAGSPGLREARNLRARQAHDRGGGRGGARGARRRKRSLEPAALQFGRHVRRTPHHSAAPAIPRGASRAHGRSDPRRAQRRLDRGRDRCGISHGRARRLRDGGARSDNRVGWCLAHPLISRKRGSGPDRLSWQIIRL